MDKKHTQSWRKYKLKPQWEITSGISTKQKIMSITEKREKLKPLNSVGMLNSKDPEKQ